MSDDLIARLKAAHDAATPGPWMGAQRLSMSPGMDGSQARIDSDLIVLVRNALPEIIEALEERERLRAVVEAARLALDQYDRDYAPGLERFFHDSELREALDALEKKG